MSALETGGDIAWRPRVKKLGPRPEPHSTKPWPVEREERLRRLWDDGLSCSAIAAKMGGGLTRNAIIGKAHRLKLPARQHVAPPRPKRAIVKRLKVKPAKVAKGRGRMPLLPFLAEPAPPPNRETWHALPGSSPIAIEDHTDGCRWPIGDDRPYRYCNEPTDGTYCEVHRQMSAGKHT